MAAFDVVVIGAGPGGYPAAIRAAQLGHSVVCVEKDRLGGVCLNWGCIPSKALLKTAELAHGIREADTMGLRVSGLEVDYPAVIARSRKVSDRFNKGVKALFKKYGVTSIEGTARLAGPGRVVVEGASGTVELEAKHVIVATGARARVFPGIEVDGARVMTYREAIVATDAPSSVIVLGAGAIGMEFAYFWRAMGAAVTVVEGASEVLPIEDPEGAAIVRKAFEKSGVAFRLDARVTAARADGEGALVTLQDGSELRADRVLVALGIQPNVEGLGLEEAGVVVGRKGIEVDTSFATSARGVYAIGDVASRGPALAHAAMRQAHVCVERFSGHHVADVDDAQIPSCTYCQPQIASIGVGEAELKKRGVAYKVGRFPFLANGKAQGAGHPEGLVKVLVGERYGEILGACIVGADATELIAELAVLRAAEGTAELLAATVHAHPTMGEAVMEAVAAAIGVSVHI
jgi:dihydrolipoamide dehydrogenase